MFVDILLRDSPCDFGEELERSRHREISSRAVKKIKQNIEFATFVWNTV